MRLTVVGCSGSYPGPDSAASCYLLEADDADGRTWRLVLDLGNGSLGQLHRFTDPLGLDAVLISHHHPDHYGDMCGYYVMRKYHPTGAQPRLPVWGPPGTDDRVALAYDLPLDPGMREEFDFTVYDRSFSIGPFDVEPVGVDHPVDSYGLRVTAGGATVGYSGDTATCAGLDRVAADVDLLLCEASFRDVDDNPPHVHLTGREAGETAARAGAKRLVLTHVPPWFDRESMRREAAGEYAGPIEVAVPGIAFDL